MKPIVVRELVKKFGELRAVDGVSFEVEDGEIFGLLGPNGAGKTTTIKILVTLLKPTSGEVFVAGNDVIKKPSLVRKSIGVVFQDTTLELDFTARENLDFHARLYGMTKEERKRRIEEVLSLVELSENADQLVKNFSGGMKRRLEIARGLLHFPKVLFLDEPTLGLDARTRRRIWKYLKEFKGETTIMLTTHYIEEAEKLCDRVAIMQRGRIIAMDSPERLVRQLEGERVTIRAENVLKLKSALKDYSVLENNGRLEIFVKNAEYFLPKLFEIARAEGVAIEEVGVRKASLEDIYVKLTGGEI
ncbi:MAG: ATP-binding cassette domain-containing protein [Archaeoglobales archaeon]|jgi:ABC-2 type transport system ATP-binding protein|nr:ATP-binding cassette domain-containing protein [Archaeoglobales archaeon]